jgi:hypothetical protein
MPTSDFTTPNETKLRVRRYSVVSVQASLDTSLVLNLHPVDHMLFSPADAEELMKKVAIIGEGL